MKIRVQQEELSQALQVMSRTTASRTTLPVLTGILFEAGSHVLTLSATDLETALRTSIPAVVEEEGAVVVPARYVTELARRAPDGEVEISTDGDRAQATMRFGKSLFQMNGFPQEQFPGVASELAGQTVDLQQRLFREAVGRTTFAVSQSDMRPVLTGVQIRLSDSGFHAIATDGFRVAHYHGEGITVEEGVEVVVPGRTLGEMARLLEDVEDPVRVGIEENRMLAKANDFLFQTNVLSGQYPSVLDMMPKEFPVEVEIDRHVFTDACERVALIANAPDRSNVLRMRLEGGTVTLSAQSPDVGQAEDVVEAAITGEPLEIAFNAKYLIDGLRHMEGDLLRCSFSGAESAAKLRGADDEYEYYVLPLRIS